MTTAPWPDVDASFADRLAARTPTPFRHGLAGDERLSLEAIALLGDELGPDAISAEKAAKPLVSDDAGATSALQVEKVSDQIRGLAANDSWFTLLNIERAPAYAELVDQMIDGIARGARRQADGKRDRAVGVMLGGTGHAGVTSRPAPRGCSR